MHRTPVIDKSKNIVVQDIIRVTDPRKSSAPLVYTVNIYRTTSRTMVNGSEHTRFVDIDLPCITNMINQEDDNIRECNAILQDQLCSHIIDLTENKGGHRIDTDAYPKLVEHQSSVATSNLAEMKAETGIVDSQNCDTMDQQH